MIRSYPYAGGNTTEISVSSFMRFFISKSSIIIYSKWANMWYKYRNREFWYQIYYVDTVGTNNKIKAKVSMQKEIKTKILSRNKTFISKRGRKVNRFFCFI